MPSATSTVIGAVLVVAILVASWWLLPAPWGPGLTLVALGGGILAGAIQLALGHRRICWLQRTVRWWFGPVGTLIDPFQSG